MARYLTGLVTTDFLRYPPFPHAGSGWRVDLVETALSRRCRSQHLGNGDSKLVVGAEVAIDAASEVHAAKAAQLIEACLNVLDGSATWSRMGGSIELKHIEQGDINDEDSATRRPRKYREGVPEATLLAANLSRRWNRVYAVSKLWLSLQVFSLPLIELDPSHSPTILKSPYPFDHVALAYAIVLANSVLEELGLEIRASQKNPSFKNGEWNPPVLEDLVARLTKAEIDLSERYLWDVRGGKTALERKRPPRIIEKAPWARWDVRSGMVEVVDAIAHVDWLRDRVSAHRFNPKLAKVLSAYEASNAQFLARRLLLESVGFWPRG